MDPLSLLREFIISKKADTLVLAGDRVDFGGRYSFAKSTPTSYKSQQGQGDFYDLESLLFFVKHHLVGGSQYRDYFKAAKAANLTQVGFLDRKDLEEYLLGKKDKSDYIQLNIPDLQADDLAHPSKRQRLDETRAEGQLAGEGAAGAAAEESTLQGILAHELQLRNRNSMLVVPNRNLTKVLAILASVQKDEQRKQAAARPQKPVIPVKGSGRYERETQQDARLRQMGGDLLGAVQTGFVTASADPSGAPPPPPGGAPPPPPPSQPAGAAPPRPPPTQQAQQRHHSGGSGSRHQQARPSSRSAPGGPPSGQQRRSGTPIIMVPPALTSLVNMFNIQPFLEQGSFKTVDECKAQGVKKQDLLKVTRTMGRSTPVSYMVTDKEPEKKEDWKRVVAVFCLGKTWQFKKWPFKGAGEGDMVDTFSRVRGFFLHYNDEKVDATVKGWNCKVMGINREGRHRDVTVAQEFWSELDRFLQAQKSTLLY